MRVRVCGLVLQGDREQVLGLPISPLCDRQNTHVAQSQIGKCHGTHTYLLTYTHTRALALPTSSHESPL